MIEPDKMMMMNEIKNLKKLRQTQEDLLTLKKELTSFNERPLLYDFQLDLALLDQLFTGRLNPTIFYLEDYKHVLKDLKDIGNYLCYLADNYERYNMLRREISGLEKEEREIKEKLCIK